MCIATLASASSAGLLHSHIPFCEPPNLTLGITAPHHARDKLAVLLFGIAVLFQAKRDNGKKVFDLRKYPLFDDFANLFIAGPGRVLAGILPRRRKQKRAPPFSETLRPAIPPGFFILGRSWVKKPPIEHLA